MSTGNIGPTHEALEECLRRHVMSLAEEIGERSPADYAHLEAAKRYVEEKMSAVGFRVDQQEYRIEGREYRNVIVEQKGLRSPEKVFVVGAHYDTVPGTPGADDNASGIACLLELARLSLSPRPAMTLHFVAFTLEEPPYFPSTNMGSRRYAMKLKKEKQQVAGMISLEMVGYYRDEPHSQHFPLPFMGLFYPNQGNFVAVAGNFRSRRLVRQVGNALATFGELPVVSVALPLIPQTGWSDNWSFWKEGYPALMITDTAFYRNPHYHCPSDLPATLDYRRMALLVSGLSKALVDLDLPTSPPRP